MSALAEQHEAHRERSGRLWRSLPAIVKPARERPVSPFQREAKQKRLEAAQALSKAFPPPGHHHLFAAAIVALDEDGNPIEEGSGQARVRLMPKWKQIAVEVGKKHGVRLNELLSARRDRKIVFARHEAFWRCRDETSLSYPQIGRLFGNRDHTTILHGIRQHEKRMREATDA